MLDVAHAVHGLGPAGVRQQVQPREFEPPGIRSGGGERVANGVRFVEVAQTAAHGVARLEQLHGDVAAHEAGNAGDKDAIGHAISPWRNERTVLESFIMFNRLSDHD